MMTSRCAAPTSPHWGVYSLFWLFQVHGCKGRQSRAALNMHAYEVKFLCKVCCLEISSEAIFSGDKLADAWMYCRGLLQLW